MATSEITLYKGCKITPDRNAMVDSIEDYLATLTTTYTSNAFQYQQMELDFDVVIVANQSNQGGGLGNYCKIKQDLKNWYFFITETSWVSEKTVRVHLSMDTINTFALDSDYNIGPKTTIVRKHKSRYKKITGSPTTGYTLLKNIDKEPEGLSGLTKIRRNKEKIYYEGTFASRLNRKWYMVFRNDTNTSYKCDLYPEDGADIPLYYKTGTNYWEFPSDDTSNSYFFSRSENGNFHLSYGDFSGTMEDLSLIWTHMCFYKKDSTYHISIGNDLGCLHSYISSTPPKVYDGKFYRVDPTKKDASWTIWRDLRPIEIAVANQSGKIYFNTISTIDKTNTELINIVECPYCPIELSWNANSELVEVNHIRIDKTNYCAVLDIDVAQIGLELTDSLDYIFKDTLTPFADRDTMATTGRLLKNDPKIWNSEITDFKYAYGNESQEILLENIKLTNNDIHIDSNIKFIPTRQLSSEKIFDISIDTTTDLDQYTHIEDFDNIIFSNTNCSIPIITDNYIYYMRNGYNLDKQSMNRQKIGAISGIALGALQTGVGFASSSVGIGVATALNGISNTTQQIVNAIASTSLLEASLSQKVSQAQHQANSISNVNNIDLIDHYTDNKLFNFYYQPSDKQITNINDLFFYTGYAYNQKSSVSFYDLNSRYWFDFIQANIVFTSYNKAYSNFTDDIKARYDLGITRYHCHTIGGVKTWDWSQAYENWESGFNL